MRADEVLRRWPSNLHASVRTQLSSVREAVEHIPLGTPAEESTWSIFRRQLQERYEALARGLRSLDVEVPMARPSNHARALFHALSGLGGVALIELALDEATMVVVAGALAGTAWSMELSRRLVPGVNPLLMRLFKRVAHPHETHLVNSATWYVSALVILSLIVSPTAAAVGLTVLAVGDPAAAIIGRRFGRTRLGSGRSLEGSLAFTAVASLVSFAVLSAFARDVPTGAAAVVALGASFAGATAEALSKRVDDNFSIPLAAGVGASLLLGVLL